MNESAHATAAKAPDCWTPGRAAVRTAVAAVALGCLSAAVGAPLHAQDATPQGQVDAAGVRNELAEFGMLMLAQPFPYEARDVAVTEVVRQMAQRTGVPVIAAEGLAGRVSVDNAGGTLRDVLDSLTEGGQAVWWFDGAAVHVEPPGAVVSRLIPLQGVRLADLRAQVKALQMDDSDWPLIASGDASAVRVVGPQGYAEAIVELVAALAANVAARPEPQLPVIIRGPGRRRGGGMPWTASPAYPPAFYPTGPYPPAAYPAPPAQPSGAGRAVPVQVR